MVGRITSRGDLVKARAAYIPCYHPGHRETTCRLPFDCGEKQTEDLRGRGEPGGLHTNSWDTASSRFGPALFPRHEGADMAALTWDIEVQVEIDRVLASLDRYRCRGCDQICLAPHVLECPKSSGGALPLFAPRPTGFPSDASLQRTA